MTSIVTFGQRKWNCPPGIGPLGSNGPIATIATTRRSRVERRQPACRGGRRPGCRSSREQVECAPRSGSAERQFSQPPSRSCSSRRSCGRREPDRLDVDPVIGARWRSPSVSARGAAPGLCVAHRNGAPRVDLRRRSGRARAVEPFPVRSRCRAEGAVEPVRPRVVRALQRLAAALACRTSEPQWRQTFGMPAATLPGRRTTPLAGVAGMIALTTAKARRAHRRAASRVRPSPRPARSVSLGRSTATGASSGARRRSSRSTSSASWARGWRR